MNNGVTKENLMLSLPSVLANDAGMQPLGETAATALAELWHSTDLPTIYSRIDELPEAVLDILAKDFNVVWYNYNHPLETKRAVIKDSFYVHKHLGTVGAVKRALSDIYPAKLEEWFEYEGDPYHFRVRLFGIPSDEIINWTLRAIELSKNVRSVLDHIVFHQPEVSGRKDLFVGIALYGASKQTMDRVELPDLSENYLEDGFGNILMDGFGVALTTEL